VLRAYYKHKGVSSRPPSWFAWYVLRNRGRSKRGVSTVGVVVINLPRTPRAFTLNIPRLHQIEMDVHLQSLSVDIHLPQAKYAWSLRRWINPVHAFRHKLIKGKFWLVGHHCLWQLTFPLIFLSILFIHIINNGRCISGGWLTLAAITLGCSPLAPGNHSQKHSRLPPKFILRQIPRRLSTGRPCSPSLSFWTSPLHCSWLCYWYISELFRRTPLPCLDRHAFQL